MAEWIRVFPAVFGMLWYSVMCAMLQSAMEKHVDPFFKELEQEDKTLECELGVAENEADRRGICKGIGWGGDVLLAKPQPAAAPENVVVSLLIFQGGQVLL